MIALWHKYTAWFEARNARERTIIAVAAIGGVFLLGGNALVFPAMAGARGLSGTAAQNGQTLDAVNAQIAQLERQAADPDAAVRAQLEQLRKSLAEQEPQLRSVSASLVPAERMPEFLKSLLARSHDLQLLSLKTLPPESADPAANSVANKGSAGLYKHGVEITVSGRFADLAAYIAELERGPQKLLWERLELNSDAYPRSTVTLTVYTLSLDKSWLVI